MGVSQDYLVLSTGLIMLIGHHKEIRKLSFRALALSQSKIRNCGLCVYMYNKAGVESINDFDRKLHSVWLPYTNQWIRSEEGLTLETSALESLYGGQFPLLFLTASAALLRTGSWLSDRQSGSPTK